MTAEDRIRATIMEQERARARQDAAAASEVIDLAELAAMTKPIREQLGWARHEVVQLIDARNNAATKEERGEAKHRLPAARARRDLYKAILSDVQTVIESEGGTRLSPFAREFLETQVVVKTVEPDRPTTVAAMAAVAALMRSAAEARRTDRPMDGGVFR